MKNGVDFATRESCGQIIGKIREINRSIADIQKISEHGIICDVDVALVHFMRTKRTLIENY